MTDYDVPAPPYDYNPSSWGQRIPICVLATIAGGMAAYMGAYQYGLVETVWDPFFGEGSVIVLDSDVSHDMRRIVGIPDAMLGAIAYLGDAIYGLAGTTRRWQYRPWMVVLFGLDVIPLGIVSSVLVFLQGTVVGAWCTLCLITAVISLILVYLAWDEVRSTVEYLWRVWRATRDTGVLWRVFWGGYDAAAEDVALGRG